MKEPRKSGEIPGVTIRPLNTLEEYHRCVELQKETWGEEFTEAVTPSQLMVTQKIGGVAAGAFDSTGRLVGLVIGFSGIREGRPVHWSHMLAVKKGMGGKGIGRRLKEYQRRFLLELGIETAFWTVDPLMAANAHFNFNRLGARPAEYLVDMYGPDTGSVLHSGIGTDRFVMEWNLLDPGVEAALKGKPCIDDNAFSESPVINSTTLEGIPQPTEGDLPDLPAVRIEIPYDVQKIKIDSLDLALKWRSSTRHAILHYFMEESYTFDGFKLDSETRRCYYLLKRS